MNFDNIFSRFIEQPPLPYRLLFPEAIWRRAVKGRKVAYLTFDDGPIPEATPWILETLDRYGVKATFFMVGENVARYPALFESIVANGHSYGNHTMRHLQGIKATTHHYMRDITEADRLIGSSLFRPPHGLMRWAQAAAIKHHYNIIMYDVVTRDYNPTITPERVLENVKRLTRNGSVIVFHDSLRSIDKLRRMLPAAIEWLQAEGYELLPLTM